MSYLFKPIRYFLMVLKGDWALGQQHWKTLHKSQVKNRKTKIKEMKKIKRRKERKERKERKNKKGKIEKKKEK